MPRSLAEIALSHGLLDASAVARVARASETRNVPLVVALVRDTGIDEIALVRAIAKDTRVPVTDPAQLRHDSDAMRLLPRDAARRLRVLPLAVGVYGAGPRVLRVAMADPTDAVVLAELEHLTGCEIDVTLMPLTATEQAIEEGYSTFVTEVVPRRPLFGENLAVSTQRVGRRHAPTPSGPPPSADGDVPATIPYHRLSDEADLEIRHRALLDLMVRKQLVTEDEYEEEVRLLMKRRDDQR